MAIGSEIRSAGPLRCDGRQKEFPFVFKVFSPYQIQVVWSEDEGGTETVAPVDAFRVELNRHQDVSPGGVVIFTSPPKRGTVLVIRSNVEYLQPMVLTNHGGFYPEILNEAADRAVVLAQQNRARLDRAVLLPYTSTKKPVEFIKEFFTAHDEALDAKEHAAKSAHNASKSEAAATRAAKEAEVVNKDTHELVPKVTALKNEAAFLEERAETSRTAIGIIEGRIRDLDSTVAASQEKIERTRTAVFAKARAVANDAEEVRTKTAEVKASAERVAQTSERVVQTAQGVFSALSEAHSLSVSVDEALTKVRNDANAVHEEALAITNVADKASQDAQKADRAADKSQKLADEMASVKLAVSAAATTVADVAARVQSDKEETEQHMLAGRKAAEAAKASALSMADAASAVDKAKGEALSTIDAAGRQALVAVDKAKDGASKDVAVEKSSAVAAVKQAGVDAMGAVAGYVDAAKRSAEEAKNAAKGATEGQVQADWTETDGTARSFVQHKPALGKYATATSISYNELTERPDLSGLGSGAPVPRTGGRGRLAGWQEVEASKKTALTIGKDSPDVQVCTTEYDFGLTCLPGGEGDYAVKVVHLKSLRDTVLRLSGAGWADGEPPVWGKGGETLTLTFCFIDGVVIAGVFSIRRQS